MTTTVEITKPCPVSSSIECQKISLDPPLSNSIDDISQYYHIHTKKLGEGGFAKVRLATHLATRQEVAIKCLDKVALGPELPRIYNEIECLKRLKHRNIARLYQVFETDSMIYLVLEYCPGGELFDYIVKHSKLTENESAQIIYDLMHVLNYIHINGFAHRDLKPENVLFDEKHQIKLIDFGLAANCSTDNMASNKNQAPIDQLSTCCGSVTYAAPEVIAGRVYSGTSCDVWSAGVMLYALLVGQLPFNDDSITKLYQKIQAGIKRLPDFLSEDASDLIQKMLTIDPKQRITVPEVLNHPWIRNKTRSFGRINRRLEFGVKNELNKHIVAKCCERFPTITPNRMRELINDGFNYYSTTYYLLKSKNQITRAAPVKRTPDRLPLAEMMVKPDCITPKTATKVFKTVPAVPHSSPSKKTRYITVSNTPRTPKTPPAFLKQQQPQDVVVTRTPKAHTPLFRQLQEIQRTPKTPIPYIKQSQDIITRTPNTPTPYFVQSLQDYNTVKTPQHQTPISGKTPKKSLVKRLLESATPAKLRKLRKIKK